METETNRILRDTAIRIFDTPRVAAGHTLGQPGLWPAAQWDAIEDAGLPLALVPEAKGGFGLPIQEALDLIRIAGTCAVPLPFAESLLAHRIAAEAGLEPSCGPLTLAPVLPADRLVLERRDGVWKLSGVAHRVPWGRHAPALVLASAPDGLYVARVQPEQATVTPGTNLADEPRDTLHYADTRLADAAVAPAGAFTLDALEMLGATARSLAMAGALERILQMTLDYAGQRTQFGRPIGQFQAIQHHLAVMAGQTAAARAAAAMATETVADHLCALAVGAAKIRCGEAAGAGAAIAHQVHGAMGFTREHSLHHFTKRLWSWRDEFGSEAQWSRRIGHEVARVGADGLWPLVTTL